MTNDPDLIPAATDFTAPVEPPVAPISAEPEYIQPPRLGIIHLLAWTAVAAVLFKVNAALLLLAKGNSAVVAPDVPVQAIGIADFTLMAAGIVGLAVLVRAWLRRQPARLAPGHWILICTVISGIVMYFVAWPGFLVRAP